uniref:ComEC/Rec2 family competence protein n=1 Tax=Ensifer adhaerens TaxID=106592 RepID=UPI003F4947C6
MTFQLTMYPATDGDCLLVRWGDDNAHKHIIVDLGRGPTWDKVRPIFEPLEGVELFTITHIDSDHIAGAVPMIREKEPAFDPRRVWFNSRQQLQQATHRDKLEPFSPVEGEKLSRGISKFKWPRNSTFESRIVSTDSPEAHGWMDIADGLRLLLLSPDDASLSALLPTWEEELKKANVRPYDPDTDEDEAEGVFELLGGFPDVPALANSKYERDPSAANGSSIAFVVELNGKRLMLTGDSHSEVLEKRLKPYADAEGGRFRVDLLKVSHHGSRRNTSPSFFKMIDCCRFAFSTDGSRQHGHPHPETIARILANDPDRPKTLYFNYEGPHAKVWKNPLLSKQWKYDAVFPRAGEGGTLEIEI